MGRALRPTVVFSRASQREQIGLLREACRTVLSRHGVEPKALKLVNHGYNTTFRGLGKNLDVALRINISSRRTLAHVQGEVAFVEALMGVVPVPRPAPLFDGRSFTAVEVPGWPEPRPLVAYDWLEGRHPPAGPNAWRATGRALGRIHRAAVSRLPLGAERPVFEDVLDGQPFRLSARVFAEVRERADALLRRFNKKPRQLVHFDLHLGNVKVSAGPGGERVYQIFDFDDAVWAHPVEDVAQVLLYVRGKSPNARRCREALWEGLETSPAELGATAEELETLVAGRIVLLANDLVGSPSSELRADRARILQKSRRILTRFLATGRVE